MTHLLGEGLHTLELASGGGEVEGGLGHGLGGENGPEALKTKAEVIKYLKDSFTFAHRAFGGITDANATASIPAPWGKGSTTRLYLASLTVAHAFDHYGQMAVYLRMNGIIPPASRKP